MADDDRVTIWWSNIERAAMQKALDTPDDSLSGPDGGASYDCENCPASFGYEPEDLRCPLCKGSLTGRIELHFYPPYEEPTDAA